MKYMLCEVVKHYHEVDIDDELDIQDIVNEANRAKSMYETGYETIEDILKAYKEEYGFEYTVKPNYMGTDSIDITVVDEIE